MKISIWSTLAILLVVIPLTARAQANEIPEQDEDQDTATVQTPPAPYAQWLIGQTAKAHSPVKALEVATEVDGVYCTIAASDDDEIGELCEQDELMPMHTGKTTIEEPTKRDPVYEVTFALHDAHGNVIGSLSLDIEPGDMDEDQVLELAQSVRTELEAKIDSQPMLFAPAP